MSETVATHTSFGGFSLGSLQLALPVDVLKEVIACQGMTDLPCPARCVIGGIPLRGMVIPVVDLRIVLGREAPVGADRSVVIVEHDVGLFGLLADKVTGMFDAVEDSVTRLSVSDGSAPVFLASVQRSDNRAMVSILSTEAIVNVPHVPLAQNLESVRERLVSTTDPQTTADTSISMLLLRCNDIPLAIDAMVVHASLFNPRIEAAENNVGQGLDVIEYAGRKVPVLDLLELCGFGNVDRSAEMQALLISFPEGHVAFLISGVIDITRADRNDVQALPAFTLPRAGIFLGSLPASRLPADVVARAGVSVSQFLVIDATGLKAREDVRTLAQLNVDASGVTADATTSSDSSVAADHHRSMITYVLDAERATPLDQIVEILPYQSGTERFRSDGPVLGFMANRGRSIPVLSLGQITGGSCQAPTPSSKVLVIESAGERLGFLVQKLISIEEAHWEPMMFTDRGDADGIDVDATRPHSQKLALFASRSTNRMLPVLDLQRIAESLHASTAPAQVQV